MREGRKIKSIRNIGYGISFQIISAAMSFVNRSFMIKYLGLDAVSLNGLFWEIIVMISMAELGVGFAVTYNLYEPLSKNDTKKITQLMQMYKKAYCIIATVTFTAGSIMAVFIPYIVNGLKYSDSEVRFIFMLYVIQSSLSYLFTYKLTILSADQNKYIYTKIQSIVKIAGSVILICVMALTRNFEVYFISGILIDLFSNICSSIAADKRYPYINDRVERLDKKEQKKVFANIKDIFIKKVSGQITNSTDNILISILVGTNLVGYYSNYSVIFSVFTKLESQISAGYSASLGNLIVEENVEKVKSVLAKMVSIYFMFAIVMSSCVYVCINPFIKIWLGDNYILGDAIIFVCCLNLFINLVKGSVWQAVDAAGLFKKDKYIAIIGNVVNLAVSLAAGYKFGMIGVFAGTTLTLLINLFLKVVLFCREVFKCKCWKYILKWSIIIALGIIWMRLVWNICEITEIGNPWAEFFKNGCVAAGITACAVGIVAVWKNGRNKCRK